MLQEMDIALADEIKKQKVDDRSRRHHVSNGIFISDFNGTCIYEFSLEDPWDVADDTPASIKFDVRQEARGAIQGLPSELQPASHHLLLLCRQPIWSMILLRFWKLCAWH